MTIRNLLIVLTIAPLMLACELGPVPEGAEYGEQEGALSAKAQLEKGGEAYSREPALSEAHYATAAAIASYEMSFDTCGPGKMDGCPDTSITVTMPFMYNGQIEWCECTGQEIEPLKEVSFAGVVPVGTCTPANQIPSAVQNAQCSTAPLNGMKDACTQAKSNAQENIPPCSGECECTYDNGQTYKGKCAADGRLKTHRTLNWANQTCTIDAEQECACDCKYGGVPTTSLSQ